VEGVRPATEDDLARLAELARAAIAELTPMKGGVVWAAREARPEPVEESLKVSLADDHTRVVVGTIDDVPIGYAAVHVEVLNDGSRLGVIDDIFVEDGAREVGVGEAMMDDLVTWCTAQGCSGMDALALPGHRSAKNFFEESGFTARKLVMHHRLGERRTR
jgi:GNAT superfamily N-acetyltransferase